MATCYRCGQPIPSTDFKLRRKVKTGEWIRRRYPNPNVSAIHIHYGIRLVCSACARAIDREQARQEMLKYIELGIALFLLLIVLVMHFLG